MKADYASLQSGVHPRVGGETDRKSNDSPRMWGPSPRGRGNPELRQEMATQAGSIPAWAGKPRVDRTPAVNRGVHPRVGGETPVAMPVAATVRGPSPRGRGNRSLLRFLPRAIGSIPAWAGKPVRSISGRVIPKGPSPRGRGNRAGGTLRTLVLRSIPAWAGKPVGLALRS